MGAGVYNSYVSLDPRLSLRFRLTQQSKLALSFGSYHQYLQLILNSISPFTALEIWLPSSPNLRPQSSQQVALSYNFKSTKRELEFTSELYLKRSKNQLELVPHAVVYLKDMLESQLLVGQAKSYGLEVLMRKHHRKVSGWVSYSFARTFKKFTDLNQGEWYRAIQDMPHHLSIVVNYHPRERFTASAIYTLLSGSTFTSPTGFYDYAGRTFPLYGSRNNDRLPAYRRMDVSMNYRLNKSKEKSYQHSLSFSIYNVFARKNVYAVKFNKELSERLNPDVPGNILDNDNLQSSQIDLLRFVPSLTYKFEI